VATAAFWANMPKSIIVFERLAWLAVALRLAPDVVSWLGAPGSWGQFVFLFHYDLLVVALRIAVIWLIVRRHSNLMRWGWIGLAVGSSVMGTAGLLSQPGDQLVLVLVLAGYLLALAAAAALLVPASWRWFGQTA